MFVSRITFALPSKAVFLMLRILRILSRSTPKVARNEAIANHKTTDSRSSRFQLVSKANVFRLFFIVVLLSTIGCGISNDKLIEQYNDFAIRSAKANLWNEAILRWQRIIEIEPNNAKAHNNLGVAYEAMERFDEALAEYEKAIELDPGNDVYQRNFFKCQKNRKRSWQTEETVKENESS